MTTYKKSCLFYKQPDKICDICHTRTIVDYYYHYIEGEDELTLTLVINNRYVLICHTCAQEDLHNKAHTLLSLRDL